MYRRSTETYSSGEEDMDICQTPSDQCCSEDGAISSNNSIADSGFVSSAGKTNSGRKTVFPPWSLGSILPFPSPKAKSPKPSVNKTAREVEPLVKKNGTLLPREICEQLLRNLDEGENEFHIECLTLKQINSSTISMSIRCNDKLECEVSAVASSSDRSSPNGPSTSGCESPDSVFLSSCPLSTAFFYRLIYLPEKLSIRRLVIESSQDQIIESTLNDVLMSKKWTVDEFEYIIRCEFNGPKQIFRLVRALSVSRLAVHIIFGTSGDSMPKSKSRDRSHLHGFIDEARTLKYAVDTIQYIHEYCHDDKTREQVARSIANTSEWFQRVDRTMQSMRLLISFLLSTRVPTFSSKYYKGRQRPEKCRFESLSFTVGGREEACHSPIVEAIGDMIIVCMQKEPTDDAGEKIRLSKTLAQFEMPIDNQLFVDLMETCKVFQCTYKTSVTSEPVIELIKKWVYGEQNFDEIKMYLSEEISSTVETAFNWLSYNHKWLYLRHLKANKKIYLMTTSRNTRMYLYLKVKSQ